MNVLHILYQSPYSDCLLEKCIEFAGKEDAEEYTISLSFITQLITESSLQSLIQVLSNHESTYTNTKERVLLAKRLFTVTLTHLSESSSDLIKMILQYISCEKEDLLDALFRLYTSNPQSLILLQDMAVTSNQETVHQFIRFIQLIHSDDPSLSSFVESHINHHTIHYLYSLHHPILQSLLTTHFPALASLDSSLTTVDLQWIQNNPFFITLTHPVSWLLFEEYMLCESIDVMKKDRVIEWSLHSLLLENQVPPSLLSAFSEVIQQLPIHIALPVDDFNALVDRLVQDGSVDEASVLLALKLLSCGNTVLKEEDLQKKKMRVILIVLFSVVFYVGVVKSKSSGTNSY